MSLKDLRQWHSSSGKPFTMKYNTYSKILAKIIIFFIAFRKQLVMQRIDKVEIFKKKKKN